MLISTEQNMNKIINCIKKITRNILNILVKPSGLIDEEYQQQQFDKGTFKLFPHSSFQMHTDCIIHITMEPQSRCIQSRLVS